jgi:hypothetical protein
MQMGMSTQLLFTTIITLMKVAILLTYLRKSMRPTLRHSLTAHRNLPVKTKQMVLPHHDLLHHLPERSMFLRNPIPMLVSFPHVLLVSLLTTPRPASTYWEIFKYIGKAKCLNIKAIYYFHSGQNTFSDFVIFLWPAKDLLNVQISLRQRVTLTSMFSLGVMYASPSMLTLHSY